MKQLFLMVDSGAVKLLDTPAPTPKEKFVLVETLYSAVSAGTERSLTSFGGKNLIQKALERPDQVKKVVEKISTDGLLTTVEAAFTRLGEPMPMGYSAVGRVLSCGRGITDIEPGDVVAMAGQAYHAEIDRVNRNLVAKLPKDFPDVRQAAFCALGAIALQGIHQSGVQSGETVAVVGMGLVGHITARLLSAYGCDVIGFDIADKTLPGTRLAAFIASDDENAEQKVQSLTHGRGADRVIITAATSSNAPMDLAAAIARDRASICMIGVTRMDIDRRPFYQKELSFTIARSYGPGRYDAAYEEQGADYPAGQVRFTEGRNLEEFIRLIATGRLTLSDLITHEIPFAEAERAYEMITVNKAHERYIGVLLQYPPREEKHAATVTFPPKAAVSEGTISVGLIGAGIFARNTMLPTMTKTGLFRLTGLATTGGTNAAQANAVNGFAYVTNDYKKLLADPEIELIVVSTNHNSHAKFVCEALAAGKHVYCEKPLCLTLAELDEIEAACRASKGQLFCGLNRRYAPLVQRMKKDLQTDRIPAVYDYIANAGFIPAEHWTQDEAVGGGRLIGEAVHFVDTLRFLDGSPIERLTVTRAQNDAFPKGDNALITIRFASGAAGSVLYTAMGSKKYPKEQLRVFANGEVMELDNYIRLARYGNAKTTVQKLRQDKGFEAEYRAMAQTLRAGTANGALPETLEVHRKLLEGLSR